MTWSHNPVITNTVTIEDIDMTKQIDITSEYKDNFVPAIYDGMTEEVLANDDNEIIDVKVIKNFMVDSAIRGENERAVIIACLSNHIGHRILARAATEYAQETGLWSGKVIVNWRAKIGKYSRETMEKVYTIKSHGKGKDRQFNVEEATANKARGKKKDSTAIVETVATDINENTTAKPATKINRDGDALKAQLAALQKEFGLAALVKAVSELTNSAAVMQSLGTKSQTVNGH